MDEKAFTSEISGEVRYSMNGGYSYFQPHDLPFDMEIPRSIYRMSLDAVISLSNLNGRVSAMSSEERDIFMRAFTLKESVCSSSIEGTRSTLSDMFRSEKEMPDIMVQRDVREVSNYMDALREGVKAISEGKKITVELLHRLHVMLLTGTRGENKSPGMFKTEQNAIGMPGDTLETAKMVPSPPESVDYLIGNLLEYMDSDEDPVVKIALVHYQFEAIHPYRDGNGRIGRLLIMLLLAKEGLLTYPAIYPSEYFDRNRDLYIDGLFDVSSKDMFEEWLSFFIKALKDQADGSISMIRNLQDYRKLLEAKYHKSPITVKAVGLMFENPYMTIADVAGRCEVSATTAAKVLSELEADGVVREVSGRKRKKLYLADGVIDILGSR
ncbi:MAG: Fic family protein [Thermoplasmata archaeon]|nr:Fic family protein [Thermoplasmata archaeon]